MRILITNDDGVAAERLTALERIAAESRHPDPALILQAGGALLEDMRARGAILGTAVSPAQ